LRISTRAPGDRDRRSRRERDARGSARARLPLSVNPSIFEKKNGTTTKTNDESSGVIVTACFAGSTAASG